MKCTKNKKNIKMFPKNVKKHDMNTRNPDYYKVQFANTDRLQKSQIIYMQNLLNEDEAKHNILKS